MTIDVFDYDPNGNEPPAEEEPVPLAPAAENVTAPWGTGPAPEGCWGSTSGHSEEPPY
jgi:hypothetical protein